MAIRELASTRDKREARERDDGNERRARAGSDGKSLCPDVDCTNVYTRY